MSVHSNVNWYALSVLIHATKGHIGRAIPRMNNGDAGGCTEEVPKQEKITNINSREYIQLMKHRSQGVILEQTAERYVKNIIELVTE